ncbi:MAG TPA: glycoside hydrolase family 38 C-terminal domain-containing protein [Armatimonadota bacterium]|jgi:alpha-mannosidase
MATDLEWQHRIEHWLKELPQHFYRPLGTVEMQGFTTFDQLTVRQAAEQAFTPMPAGTSWGAKWEYGWFRGTVTLPDEAAGRRIALRVDVGGESAIYVNAQNAGAKDHGRQEITLALSGEAGATYDIMVEAYGGHGPLVWTGGPVPPDRETVPEPPAQQCVVGTTTFGIWQEEVYQLWIDVKMLEQMSRLLDPESLRWAEIVQGLRDFTVIVDFETAREEMLATVRAARERLAPLFACENGSTAPQFFAVGHSHIDVAWLWPLRETESKCTRTFANQMALMEEYPEYVFLQSQPHLYWMVKNHYPELYARVKEKVASGQIIADGGMWVEPDMNITSGESLIRQFVHGKRFYREEFGVESELLWLPDVFGYSGALPQIMRGCGVKYFSTQKIYWVYNGGDPFPYTTFTWEGIDGSEVLAGLHNDYNSHSDPESIVARWHERRQKVGISTRLFPFGFGDGGGGATRDHLEFIRRERNLEGLPKVRMAGPMEYFHDLEARGYPDDRYVGELYFQNHRGVLTTQARTKRGNRKSEYALREAEMWAVAARALAGFAIPLNELDLAWKEVLLNQFHDIIPGSSIHRVYEEAEAGYARVIEMAEETAAQAAATLTDDSSALTVFNALSWPRTELVALPDGVNAVTDAEGNALPMQTVEGELLAEVSVPSCGWTTLQPAATPAPVASVFTVHDRLLENDLLRVTFNDLGEITGIYDKTADLELAAGPCNSFKMYKDVPSAFDAWDLEQTYACNPVALPEAATITVVADGPLVSTLRVSRQLHHSTMTQDISLRRGSRRVEFATTVDWHERHKLLKVAFPVNVYANEALHEIQFGHLARPNHYSRPYDADRFEVSNQKWTALVEGNRGCAVLNDCKYGVNVLGNSINLTLLRAPLAPDMTADQCVHQFTYAFYAWNGCLVESDLVREGYELNIPVMSVSGAAGARSLFSVDARNVVIDTVKPAEDGSGDIVLRLYETMRTTTRCTLTTTLPVTAVHETDMLEEHGVPLPLANGALALTFRPFEIKTVRLR